MKKLFILPVLVVLTVLLITVVNAQVEVTTSTSGSGAIWTTNGDCGDQTQDVNQYNLGEVVYINGDNFEEGSYDWAITGQPGGASCDPSIVVANGDYDVDESGAFCFEAYTVENDDCGVYTVDFGKKNDNYHVIPEFGAMVGILTVLSAIGVFFIIRRK